MAEYEHTLIAERLRRGRQAQLRSGQLLPWTLAPYGYLLAPQRPRDPSRARSDAVKAAVVAQIFAWYTDHKLSVSLYWVANHLSDAQIPTPSGRARWHGASVRGLLRNPAYAGTAYSGRTHPAPARHRKSALQPVGPGASQRPASLDEWIAVPVPALISQETFAAAQSRLDRNTQFARRNNTAHDYLLRGLVSCGQCQLACMGRTLPTGYTYYTCRGRSDALRTAANHRCTARYAPARALDTLVWQDLCRVLTEPALITHELARAQGGEWLPHALHARRQTLRKALAELDRQQARLLEVYLAAIIGRDELERKHQEVTHTQQGLAQQLRQLDLQAQQQVDVAALAQGIETFCHRLRPTLDPLTFAQRSQLVTLLIERVIVSDGQVEIRYVVPTGPKGETVPFCHLRLDYFHRPPLAIGQGNQLSVQVQAVGHQQQHNRGAVRMPGCRGHDHKAQGVGQPGAMVLRAHPPPQSIGLHARGPRGVRAGLRLGHLIGRPLLHPRHETAGQGVQLLKQPISDIPTIKDVKASRLHQAAHLGSLRAAASRERHAPRDLPQGGEGHVQLGGPMSLILPHRPHPRRSDHPASERAGAGTALGPGILHG